MEVTKDCGPLDHGPMSQKATVPATVRGASRRGGGL